MLNVLKKVIIYLKKYVQLFFICYDTSLCCRFIHTNLYELNLLVIIISISFDVAIKNDVNLL